MYIPIILMFLAGFLFQSAVACTTDDDCSLNGICTDSTCICDPGWTSSDCGKLDLLPATRYTGYNHTNVTLPSYYSTKGGNSSWGGHILRDRQDPKLFHLVIAQFAKGCGLSGWRPFSFVIRAESKNGPQGPYEYAQTLTSTFRHNPTTFWSEADQRYLMYTIGIDTEVPSTCKSYKWANNISVSSAPDIRGPWTPFEVLINGTNPAPWPAWSPDNHTGEIILGSEDVRIWSSGSVGFSGQYQLIKTMSWNTSDYSPTWTEDPFLWRDKRGHWHALAHWMIDIAEHGVKYPRVGAHMFSRTLMGNWSFKLQETYNTTVLFTDESRTDYYRRERPKLFFSGDGELTPLYLVNGVQEFNSSSSYTLIQPIGQASESFERSLGF